MSIRNIIAISIILLFILFKLYGRYLDNDINKRIKELSKDTHNNKNE